MPFTILRQDITKMQVDAIVNAANTELRRGSGVCGAIFQAAGVKALEAACNLVAPIATGKAVSTPGFALPCKYIIHAAGPVYRGKEASQCEALLRSAYRESLELAFGQGCESIAVPLISSGIYGYPKGEALRVAISTIKAFLEEKEMDVYLVIFDKVSFVVSEELLGPVDSYIDEHYVESHHEKRRSLLRVEREALCEEEDVTSSVSYDFVSEPAPTVGNASKPLEEMIEDLDEPFNLSLLRLIDEKGKTDVEVYKKANIDRKLFSKIRTGKGYVPSKRTVLALAIALELSLEETDQLLERAGFALSHSQKFDVIIEYFILNQKYDIFEINEVLFQYDQPLLGAM